MSPITAAPEGTLPNGNSGPEPRFVLSPPDSPTRTLDTNKSQCSSLSDGDSYECYGEGNDLEADSGIVTERQNG